MVNLRQEFPAWYYCLHALTIKEDQDVIPEDFDEDLSSLFSLSLDSGADDDEDDVVDRDDTISIRSYNGLDADYYHELKADCKAQKLELKEIKEHNQQFKDSQQTFDQDKEREVQEMYDSLKNAKHVSRLSNRKEQARTQLVKGLVFGVVAALAAVVFAGINYLQNIFVDPGEPTCILGS
ncbi:hypothetical protein CISG_07442 [Coccidioides immitis RMSCC 3703]|uniref:Uncharacterized protein n=1 Tax=Coccidioides immitis RMSCC 3703 TaxID=454286 RepID=A0A0J8R3Y3_COCIT|nr:hypothetical protein CISG_07442 [Coccidioides immitis RMSCC 3703]